MMTSQLPTASPAISPTSAPATTVPLGATSKYSSYGDLAEKAAQASEEIDKAATAAQQPPPQPAAAAAATRIPEKKLKPTTVKGAAVAIGQWTATGDLKLYYGKNSFELHIGTERKLVSKFDTIGALSFDPSSGLLRLRPSSPPHLSVRISRHIGAPECAAASTLSCQQLGSTSQAARSSAAPVSS